MTKKIICFFTWQLYKKINMKNKGVFKYDFSKM